MILSQLFDTLGKVEYGAYVSPAQANEISPEVITVKQIHSNAVVFAERIDDHAAGDAIISGKRRRIGIKTADCLPILVVDTHGRKCAVIHGGWKGLYKGVIQNTIRILKFNNIPAKDLIVYIGPHIRQCCYEVAEERYGLFQENQHTAPGEIRDGAYFLSLKNIAMYQLQTCGISTHSIEVSPVCCCCDAAYPSYRRNPQGEERLISYIEMI